MRKVIIVSVVVISILWFVIILALCRASKDDKDLEDYYNINKKNGE